MRGFFYRLGNTIQRFMYGRYGIDGLSKFMLIIAIVFSFASMIRILSWLSIPAFVLIILSYIRALSKNHAARRREENAFLKIKNKITSKFSFWKRRHADRKTHRYFKCKLCKSMMRVPKGKGKIEITCPKCKARVIKKT